MQAQFSNSFELFGTTQPSLKRTRSEDIFAPQPSTNYIQESDFFGDFLDRLSFEEDTEDTVFKTCPQTCLPAPQGNLPTAAFQSNHNALMGMSTLTDFTMPVNNHHNPTLPGVHELLDNDTNLSPTEEIITPATPILLEQQQRLILIRNGSEKLRWAQREILSPANQMVTAQAINQLDQQQKRLRQEVERTQSMLECLSDTVLLPEELHKLGILKNDLQIEHRQLEMYELELQQYLQGNSITGNGRNIRFPRVVASLVITKHPFPKSVQQNKPLESGVTVRLLTGAAQNLWPCGPVKAEVTSSDLTTNSKNNRLVKNNEKEMEDNTANFNELIFPTGTRKKFIHLKFKMDVQMGAIKATIESNNSDPIIVKTNESQWQESEGILLRHEAFGHSLEVGWCKFANALQRRYLMATKQDRQKPARPLSIQDLYYLFHTKFGPNTMPTQHTMVTMKQFDNFWAWFGPGLFKIRSQRHLCSLWVRGLICGFISRVEAEAILENATPGAFLIRFSEQCPGQFAIAYIPMDDNPCSSPFGAMNNMPHGGTMSNGQGRVRHYLMQRDDIFGSKKTLADFLGSARNFTHIVQIVDHPTRGRIFQQCDKNAHLCEYYSKRGADNTYGYENKL